MIEINEAFKETLLKKLKSEKVTITFIKINNETRNMTCTLMENSLPSVSKDDLTSQKKIRQASPEILAVWDLNKNAWRSMRWDKIIEVIDG
jgi:hypothetical protein